MLELYKNIRLYRKENKLTQDELAKRTGYTDRSSIAKIEKGEIDLPQSKILLFASALNVTPGELMGNTGLSPEASATPLNSGKDRLNYYYSLLNDYGQEEAVKRVQELTEIERYKKGSLSSGRAEAG